jgi:hypothetical protein
MQIRAHRDREYQTLCLFVGDFWYGQMVVIVEICRLILSLYYYSWIVLFGIKICVRLCFHMSIKRRVWIKCKWSNVRLLRCRNTEVIQAFSKQIRPAGKMNRFLFSTLEMCWILTDYRVSVGKKGRPESHYSVVTEIILTQSIVLRQR